MFSKVNNALRLYSGRCTERGTSAVPASERKEEDAPGGAARLKDKLA